MQPAHRGKRPPPASPCQAYIVLSWRGIMPYLRALEHPAHPADKSKRDAQAPSRTTEQRPRAFGRDRRRRVGLDRSDRGALSTPPAPRGLSRPRRRHTCFDPPNTTTTGGGGIERATRSPAAQALPGLGDAGLVSPILFSAFLSAAGRGARPTVRTRVRALRGSLGLAQTDAASLIRGPSPPPARGESPDGAGQTAKTKRPSSTFGPNASRQRKAEVCCPRGRLDWPSGRQTKRHPQPMARGHEKRRSPRCEAAASSGAPTGRPLAGLLWQGVRPSL